MPTIWERFKRRLTTGQREREAQRDQTVQTPKLPEGFLTEDQRLQSVERQPNLMSGGTPREDLTPEQRLQSVEGQPQTIRDRLASTDIRDRPALQEIRDAADAAGFDIVRDAEFESTSGNNPLYQKGLITYTRRDTGESFSLTWAEYRALSKGAIGNPNDPNYVMDFSENLERLQNAQLRTDELRTYLESQLRGTALSEELAIKYADALDKMQNLDTDIMSIADAEALFEGELPEGLLSGMGLLKLGGAGVTGGIAVSAGGVAMAIAAPVAIGLLITAYADVINVKQKRLDVINQKRQGVKEFLPKILAGANSGLYNPAETAEMIRIQIDILRASEAIAKREGDTMSGAKLTDARKAQEEIRNTLDFLIPDYQRALAQAYVTPTGSGLPEPILAQ